MLRNLLIILVLFFTIRVEAQIAGLSYELDTTFQHFHQRERISGAVLVAHNGKVVYQKALGYTNGETKEPLRIDNAFNLASVSKQFTTMCIMILKERGKLQYDDLAKKYLPTLPYDNITIRQLMNHVAGVPEYFDLYEKEFPKDKIFTNKDLLELYAKYQPPLDFQPGEKFQYSNTGFLLLASIVEAISGMRFQDFVTQNIIKPLHLKHTFPFTIDMKKSPKDRVYGFEYKGDTIVKNDIYNIDGVIGDGNMYASVGDLQKWSQALYKNKLVKAETTQEAYQPAVLNNGEKSYYGFGWVLKEDGSRVSHTGGWVGFLNYIQRDLDGAYEIVVLTNSSTSPRKMIETLNQIIDKYR